VTQPKRKPQSGRYPRAPREDDECVDAPSDTQAGLDALVAALRARFGGAP